MDLPRVRLDGGVKAFRQRWGYELQPPPTLVEEDEDGGGISSLDAEVASIASPIGESRPLAPRQTALLEKVVRKQHST